MSRKLLFELYEHVVAANLRAAESLLKEETGLERDVASTEKTSVGLSSHASQRLKADNKYLRGDSPRERRFSQDNMSKPPRSGKSVPVSSGLGRKGVSYGKGVSDTSRSRSVGESYGNGSTTLPSVVAKKTRSRISDPKLREVITLWRSLNPNLKHTMENLSPRSSDLLIDQMMNPKNPMVPSYYWYDQGKLNVRLNGLDGDEGNHTTLSLKPSQEDNQNVDARLLAALGDDKPNGFLGEIHAPSGDVVSLEEFVEEDGKIRDRAGNEFVPRGEDIVFPEDSIPLENVVPIMEQGKSLKAIAYEHSISRKKRNKLKHSENGNSSSKGGKNTKKNPPKKKSKTKTNSRVVLAPTSLGGLFRSNAPRFSYKHTGTSTVIKKEEYCFDMPRNQTFVPYGFSLTPTNSALFPWLSQFCNSFEEFKIHKLRFEYRTEESTTQTGVVLMAFDYDPTDSLPTDKSSMMQYQGCTRSSPWMESALHFKNGQAELKKWFLDPLSSAGGGATYDTTVSRFSTPATAIFASTGNNSSSGTLGEIWVNYEIELISSHIPPIPIPQRTYRSWSSVTPVAGDYFGIQVNQQTTGYSFGTSFLSNQSTYAVPITRNGTYTAWVWSTGTGIVSNVYNIAGTGVGSGVFTTVTDKGGNTSRGVFTSTQVAGSKVFSITGCDGTLKNCVNVTFNCGTQGVDFTTLASVNINITGLNTGVTLRNIDQGPPQIRKVPDPDSSDNLHCLMELLAREKGVNQGTRYLDDSPSPVYQMVRPPSLDREVISGRRRDN